MINDGTVDLENPASWPRGVFTCHTSGCENENIPIPLQVPANPAEANVTCGVCGEQITDKRAA